jgi:hypothetical protein
MRRRIDPAARSAMAIAAAILVVACGSVEPRAGMECAAVHEGGADVQAALDRAAAGDCVLLRTGPYAGGLEIPDGVTLGAARGAGVRIDGSDDASVAIRLGAGAGLWGIEVDARGSHGVLVSGGPAFLRDVVIHEAEIALLVQCQDAACEGEAQTVHLLDVTLLSSRIGLWARGASVRVAGGRSEGHGTTRLTGGYGVIASHGARLEMNETRLHGNAVGLLLDGAQTAASLTDLQVTGNLDRGIWAQGLRGNLDAPALRIEGTGTRIEDNRMVGIGARDAQGIIIVDSRVAGTRTSPVQVDQGGTAEVGDGIGLFADTGEVRIEGMAIEENARAQILVNEGATGIIIVDSYVGPSELGHGVVIQDTAVSPTLSEDLEAQTEYDLGLAISSAALDVPGLDDDAQ